MRLDKFLKVSRILKRRTVSKELADNGRVLVNGRPGKPATPIKVGDQIEVVFGYRHLTVRVLSIENDIHKKDADSLYEVIAQSDMTPKEEK